MAQGRGQCSREERSPDWLEPYSAVQVPLTEPLLDLQAAAKPWQNPQRAGGEETHAQVTSGDSPPCLPTVPGWLGPPHARRGPWGSGPAGRRPHHLVGDAGWADTEWTPCCLHHPSLCGSLGGKLALPSLWAVLRGQLGVGLRSNGQGWAAGRRPGLRGHNARNHQDSVGVVGSYRTTRPSLRLRGRPSAREKGILGQMCFTAQRPHRPGPSTRPVRGRSGDLARPEVPGPSVECAGPVLVPLRGEGRPGQRPAHLKTGRVE